MQPTLLTSRREPGSRVSLVQFPGKKAEPSNERREVVYLIGSEDTSHHALIELLSSSGMHVCEFKSTREYLRYARLDSAACLFLDLPLPDISSLELIRLSKEQAGPPVIFLSDLADVADAVCALRAGAMEFFDKPVDPDTLLAAIRGAFAHDRKVRQKEEELAKLRSRLSLLTPREREVLPLVIGGLFNKRAAAVLGISEVTLQIHRSQVMRKMAAKSVADLVRMAVKLRIPHRRDGQSAQAHSEADQRRNAECWRPGRVAS